LANNNQQKKRIRQDIKRNERNSQIKSSIRTIQKRIVRAIDAKEKSNSEEFSSLLKKYTKTIDTAAGKGVLHKKTASRRKSRISKKINAYLQQQT